MPTSLNGSAQCAERGDCLSIQDAPLACQQWLGSLDRLGEREVGACWVEEAPPTLQGSAASHPRLQTKQSCPECSLVTIVLFAFESNHLAGIACSAAD